MINVSGFITYGTLILSQEDNIDPPALIALTISSARMALIPWS